MNHFRLLLLPLCFVAAFSQAQESFRVELGKDGETIADMRPVFLKFETRPLPAISPAEVARRYQQLFNTTDEPAVRVDALNRLTNIRDRSGEDIGFTPTQEAAVYREALESYESILERGSFGGRLDELLYQMAKAHAFTGQNEASVKRLEQLVGLYPDSPLVPEARFRIAESAFAAGNYAQAEAGYQALVDQDVSDKSTGVTELQSKARYMLGWSLYKQGPQAWGRAGRQFVAVLDEALPATGQLDNIPESSVDSIDDTLRVLALMASRRSGADTLIEWLQPEPLRTWTPLAFDRLADLYAIQGEAEASVATNRAFVDRFPEHPQRAGFMGQIVDVWNRAGKPARARNAMADYVTLFAGKNVYDRLAVDYREKWRDFSRFLAEHHYAAAAAGEEGVARHYLAAAGYYEALAERNLSERRDSGAFFRLAGDAWLQAGEYSSALANFRVAAYDVSGYNEGADSGWAAVILLRRGASGDLAATGFQPGLTELSAEADRFTGQYPADTRAPGLLADLAARWLENGRNDRASHYAGQAVTHQNATPETRYAGWAVMAQVRQMAGEYGLAERAWREALNLANHGSANRSMQEEIPRLRQQLATAVYRRGEQAAAEGKVAVAVEHFQRVEAVLPGSEIATKGRFDAANTLLKASEWQPAITELGRFRDDYPGHPLAESIGEKLVLAYTSSGQPARAAAELMDMAGQSSESLLVAGSRSWNYQLRAAELFDVGGKIGQRNAIYKDYLALEHSPQNADEHIKLQTLRQRLIETDDQVSSLRAGMVAAELESPWHSEDSLRWAARSALVLGARAAAAFAGIELTIPLESSLQQKQVAMEKAQAFFRNAESLGGATVLPESLFRRAELHRIMARDLMASAAPDDLNELEKMQYTMLLEEEAYPFEERAIALHSQNHQSISAGRFNAWIEKSLNVLAELYPGRYNRPVRWMSMVVEGENEGA